MKVDGGTPTAAADDPRLTSIGRFLRRYKLDELPTLINVLKGDITVVGPRPDVPSEIDSLEPWLREVVLSVKPGLISPATLAFIDEDERLRGAADPHKVYTEEIKPAKYRLNHWYVLHKSPWLDFKIIVATSFRLLRIPIRIQVVPKELCQ